VREAGSARARWARWDEDPMQADAAAPPA
jgi:hypothetical protein